MAMLNNQRVFMIFVRSETNHFCNAQKKVTRCIPDTYKIAVAQDMGIKITANCSNYCSVHFLDMFRVNRVEL